MFALVITAVGAFASTNLDDLLLLAAWIADRRLRVRHIVIGQYIGIGALLAVSAFAAFVGDALALPTRWLGLLPIAIGLRRLWQLRQPRDDTPMPAGQAVGAVVAMTIANGGDNLAVYVPLLIAQGLGSVPVFALVFVIMTAAWCRIGLAFVTHPTGGRLVDRYGRKVVPFALIAIGVYILAR